MSKRTGSTVEEMCARFPVTFHSLPLIYFMHEKIYTKIIRDSGNPS